MVAIMSHPVIAIAVFIGILVFVHELGHFLVGKACGIGVEVFSIGFGPKIFSFTRKGTEYQLAWIPLGGFVKFAGAVPSEEVAPQFVGHEMYRASRLARILTIAAGPGANLLMALVVYTCFGYMGVKQLPAVIGQVIAGGAAEQAGLLPGDEVLQVNQDKVEHWDQLRTKIAASPEQGLDLLIKRRGEEMVRRITPAADQGRDEIGREAKQGRVGITYGFVPAVVSVNAKQSAAGEAGLQNGELIKTLSFEVGEGKSSHFVIKHWADLQLAVWEAFQAQADSMQLSIAAAPLPGQAKADLAPAPPAAERVIHLASGSVFAQQAAKRSAPFSLAAVDALLRDLGIVDSQLTIASVKPPLEGVLQQGDRLVAVAGQELGHVFALAEVLAKNTEPELPMTIQRGFERLEVKVPLQPVDEQRMEGKVTAYAFTGLFWGQPVLPELKLEVYKNPLDALKYGVRETGQGIRLVAASIWGLVSGSLPLKALGGPMLIAHVAAQAVELGWEAFFFRLALVSINLALFNLIPIPLLDGGQLLLVVAEAIKRRPLTELAVENFQRVGFVMMAGLVTLVFYNDVSRYWSLLLREWLGFFN